MLEEIFYCFAELVILPGKIPSSTHGPGITQEDPKMQL